MLRRIRFALSILIFVFICETSQKMSSKMHV
jgi:hypothetical protein